MISFTTFSMLITVTYVWFAIGAVVITIFAGKELWTMLTTHSNLENTEEVLEDHKA